MKNRKSLSPELMEAVHFIRRAFAEHDDRTADEWAAEWLIGDESPAREIAIWKVAAEAYLSYAKCSEVPAIRAEIFGVISGCLHGSSHLELPASEYPRLGVKRAEAIRGTTVAVFKALDFVCEHGYVAMHAGVHTDIEYSGDGPIKMATGTQSRCVPGLTGPSEVLGVTIAPVYMPDREVGA